MVKVCRAFGILATLLLFGTIVIGALRVVVFRTQTVFGIIPIVTSALAGTYLN